MAVVTLPQTLYADLSDLKTRVREDVLLSCLDFDRDGVIDAAPLMTILRPASTDIDMALSTTSGIYPTPFVAPFPTALLDLALDGCHWRLGSMYPTYVIIDHATLRLATEKKLDLIRRGHLNLGQKPPEPSAIQGGALYPNPACQTQRAPIFANDQTRKWGIF